MTISTSMRSEGQLMSGLDVCGILTDSSTVKLEFDTVIKRLSTGTFEVAPDRK